MKQAVPHHRFMNIARLRVGDIESVISAVDICFHFQFIMQGKDVVHQPSLEFLHVFFIPLAAHEFFPRLKQILYRDDILVGMSEQTSLTDPPPQEPLACFGANQTSLSAVA